MEQVEEMERKKKRRGRRRSWKRCLHLSLNRRGEKDGRLGRQGVDTVFSWESKRCGYQRELRVWGEIFI